MVFLSQIYFLLYSASFALTVTFFSNSSSAMSGPGQNSDRSGSKVFSLKKWNLVGIWSWDVECDTCAICRVHVMDACLRCQNDSRAEDCVVVWGDCNHVFHNCCMSLWVKQNNRCPLCQQEWSVKRIGKWSSEAIHHWDVQYFVIYNYTLPNRFQMTTRHLHLSCLARWIFV